MSLDDTDGDPDPLFAGYWPGSVVVQFVSDNYFTVLGAPMSLGRGFLPEENRAPGAAPVIVLSHLFWQRQLHGDPDILGKTITLRRKAFTVIGVAAEETCRSSTGAARRVDSTYDVVEQGAPTRTATWSRFA